MYNLNLLFYHKIAFVSTFENFNVSNNNKMHKEIVCKISKKTLENLGF